jgi:ribosomal-protein-alanine N-acetyltransferase
MKSASFSIMPVRIDTNSDYRRLGSDVKQYRIRAMTVSDIPTVIQIDRATWGDKSWPIEHFFDFFDDPRSNCWILENNTIDDSILGYGFQKLTNGLSHITNLCLHPNQRGRGLGGILLRHMIDYARWLNISIVELEVDTSNIRAYTLYYKHGFRIIQYLERYYSEINDAYRMRLFINRIDK